MKKLFLLCIMLVVLTTCVFAANDAPQWFFNNMKDIREWTYKDCTYTVEENYIELSHTGTDPWMMLDVLPNKRFEGQNMPYVAVRMKITGEAADAGLFYDTSEFPGPNGAEYTKIGDLNGEWQEFIVDMSAQQAGRWNGACKRIRFDFINGNFKGQKVQIDRFGVFRTYTEAKDFLAIELGKNMGAEPPRIDFKDINEKSNSNWTLSSCTLSFVKGVTNFTTSSGVLSFLLDPYMTYTISEDNQFSAETYPYFAYRYKNKGAQTTGGLFFRTSNDTDFKDARYKPFTMTANSSEWETQIIDMSSLSTWTGTITHFRLDAVNTSGKNGGANILLDKMGFFATREEAEEFLSNDIAAPGDGTHFVWHFANESDLKQFGVSDGAFEHKGNVGYFSVGATDPWIRTYPKDWYGEYINAEQFPILGVRMAIDSTLPNGGLFFEDVAAESVIVDSYSQFKITADKQWHTYIVDLSDATAYPKQKWTGDMELIRLDMVNGTDITARIYMDAMGFFTTKEEAENYFASFEAPEIEFNSDKIYTSQVLRNDVRKVIVPQHSTVTAANTSTYSFSIAATVGTKYEEGQPYVVMYKPNSSSVYSPVSMSYVTSKGYPNFIAENEKGTYKLGYYGKKMNDSTDHWAKEFIEFTTQRAIFSGTSTNEFSPDMPLTRGMFITALGRMHPGTDGTQVVTTYTDVNPDAYYAPYLAWAQSINLTDDAFPGESFHAEKAITREEMAIVANAYLKHYNFCLRGYSNVQVIDEIETLSDAGARAVEKMIDLGVMGMHEGKVFDVNGIVTRADGAEFFTKLIKAILVVPVEEFHDAEFFAKPRIKIAAWTGINGFEFDEAFWRNYVDAGFNWIIANSGWDRDFLFTMADKYGVDVLIKDSNYREENFPKLNAYSDHPSWEGNYITDEPGTDEYPGFAALANPFYAYTGGKMPFINLLPMYANAAQLKYGADAAAIEYYDPDPELYTKYCQSFIDQFDAPYICTDIYPFNWSNGTKTTYKNYLESIDQIAKVARDANVEFYCCIQTFGWTASKRTPNAEEYRWQCYCLLSFGCIGLMAWNYQGSEPFPSLVQIPEYTNTQAYYDIRTAFREMNLISDKFVEYKNLGAFNVNNNATTYPYAEFTNQYDGFTAAHTFTATDNSPLLIGCFERIEGDGDAFTIVNMTEFSANKTISATFKIADTSKTVTAYPRGIETVLTPDASGVYTLSLPCGEGIFVTIE